MFCNIFAILVVAIFISTCHAQSCSPGFSCIPIRECPESVELAHLVKNTQEVSKKQIYLDQIRETLCGNSREYFVCCENFDDEKPEVVDLSDPCKSLPEIGRMKQLTFHPVSGHVVAKNENTILICDFVYDGEGPDAFLVVGNRQASSSPNSRDAIPILPASKSNKKFNFKDKDIPILGAFRGQTLELSVPEGETSSSLKWISVFCRDYDVDFGNAVLNQDVPKRF